MLTYNTDYNYGFEACNNYISVIPSAQLSQKSLLTKDRVTALDGTFVTIDIEALQSPLLGCFTKLLCFHWRPLYLGGFAKPLLWCFAKLHLYKGFIKPLPPSIQAWLGCFMIPIGALQSPLCIAVCKGDLQSPLDASGGPLSTGYAKPLA